MRKIFLLFFITLFNLAPLKNSGGPIFIDTSQFQYGDLVFKKGNSWHSDAISAMSGDSKYSHVGVIIHTSNKLAVLHAAPDDDGLQMKGQSRIDSLQQFLQPGTFSSYAVYRGHWNLNPHISIDNLIGKKFDSSFDLSESERLYCTELVLLFYQLHNINLEAQSTFYNLIYKRGSVITPDSLSKAPGLNLLYGQKIH